MNIDRLISRLAQDEPTLQEIEIASTRVRERLFPAAPATASTGVMRNCADFASLIPSFLAGTLDPSRRLLFEVHTRECVNCRHALDRARHGASAVLEFRAPRKSYAQQYAWAAAAAVVLIAGSTTWWVFREYPALGGGPRATVESVDGALYKVAGSAIAPIAPGTALNESDVVRTAKNSTAVLRLNDGSKIELNQRAEISVTRSWSGSTIHLAQGNIIVEAAKQRSGSLQVLTADCNVSVKGTVFSVESGAKGSRVAVAEGTVWVDHGSKHDVLHRGDTTATAADMSPVALRDQFEWSRNSAQYIALLGDLAEMNRRILQIPAQNLRYESKLLNWLPGNVGMVAAVPNIGGTIGEAARIFHERVGQSENLRAWWEKLPAAQRQNFDSTVMQLQTAGAYLGNEIVIAVLNNSNNQPAPVILAEMTHNGLEAYLRQQLPANVIDGHMRFGNGLFVGVSNTFDLDRVKADGDFIRTGLYQRLSPSYKQGAGWLFGADLSIIARDNPAGARYVVAESRTMGAETQSRASVVFNREREGLASWLAAPAPMGSLDFISPDAGLSVSMILKSPSSLLPELAKIMPKTQMDSVFLTDLAPAFGGEVTIALDGPLLPFPSWKIVAEVYSPDRIQSAIAKLIADNPDLHLTQTEDGYSMLKSDKYPWEAHWTFVDGYWVAAANKELLLRSMQNRQTGYTLQKSTVFRSQLPQDASANYSALIFHNLGQTLAPLAGLLNLPITADKAAVICFWAQSDRIDAATKGLLGLDSLLAMKSFSPGDLVRQALPASQSFHAPTAPKVRRAFPPVANMQAPSK